MTEPTLEDQERIHEKNDTRGYVARLRELREAATPEQMAICRAWNEDIGPHFSWPGYGSADWVAQELGRSRIAVEALAKAGLLVSTIDAKPTR